MRNIITTLLGCAALTFGMVACDEGTTIDPFGDAVTNVPDGTAGDATGDGTGTPDGGTPDATTTTQYFAIYVADVPDFDCSPNSKNHGADVDAAELFDDLTGDSQGYVTNASGVLGDGSPVCSGAPAADKQVPNEFTGAPDGAFSGGFVALAGGYLTGEFGSLELTAAYTLQVYEVGVDICGDLNCKDDPMQVGVATDLSCDVFGNTCSVELSSEAYGDASIPLTGL